MARTPRPMMLALPVLALLCAGCAVPPPAPDTAAASPRMADQPPSRVFESERQRDLAAIRAERVAVADEPWYAGRRDLEPTVVVGDRHPVVESSVTITTDRQRIIRGRAFDHHRTTTYRRETRIGIR